MDFNELPVWADIKPIIEREIKGVKIIISGVINTPEEDIEAKLIETLDVLRDYGNNLGDYNLIQLKLPLGVYQKQIYKHRHNLEFTLTKKVVVNGEVDIYFSRFKLLIVNMDKSLDGTTLDYLTEEELNTRGFVLIKGQLVNRGLEVLRVKTTGGIYRNATIKDIIIASIDREAKKILIDGKPILNKLDITEPENVNKHGHVIIPHGTRVLDLPNYLHRNSYGIYPGGIATYIQEYNRENVCFIYPLFDFKKYNNPAPKLNLYGIPTNRYDNIENTWLKDGDVVKIIVGNHSDMVNDGEKEYMNTGDGFRMPDAQAYMKKPIEITKDGPKANRKRLAYEVAIKDRDDGINYAHLDEPRNNPFLKYEQVLKNSGVLLTFKWRFSNDELIYPGMPCRYIFTKGSSVYELDGTVHQIHTVISLDQVSYSSLTVFIERKNFDIEE